MRLGPIALAFVGAWTALAQSSTPSSYEVASIRPADPAETMAIHRDGNRIAFTNYSLEMLIEWAYDIRSDRLLGKPKGLGSARYDINAAIPQRTLGPGELYAMMRTLLAERFHLTVHTESRELTHYEMVVDKGGARVHPEPLVGPAGQNPFSMTARGRLAGSKVTTGMLAKVLSEQTGRFVEDHTGLSGVFDFTLTWIPDSVGAAEETDAQARVAPSIFTAVKEQLGFRLDARKGPVEVIVIDRVANGPTDN